MVHLNWFDIMEEQTVQYHIELICKKSMKHMLNVIDPLYKHLGPKSARGLPLKILDNSFTQICKYAHEAYSLPSLTCLDILKFSTKKNNWFRLNDINTGTSGAVVLVSAGSTYRLNLFKDDIQYKSIFLSPGSSVKLEDKALEECQFLIPGRNHDMNMEMEKVNRTEFIYILCYY